MTVLHPYCGKNHDFNEPCSRVAQQSAPLIDATWTLRVQIFASERQGAEPAQPVVQR